VPSTSPPRKAREGEKGEKEKEREEGRKKEKVYGLDFLFDCNHFSGGPLESPGQRKQL